MTSGRLAASASWLSQDSPAALVTTMPSPSTISRWTSSCPSGERRSMVAERFPLFSPVQ